MSELAIVHECLATYAGSEKVIEQMLAACPEAKLFALAHFMREEPPDFLKDREVQTTFLERMPFARRAYRHYLPLMPLAIEQLNVTEADVVVSSQHCVSHGVICRPDQVHLSYVHSPVRYAWELQFEYLREANLSWGLRSIFARMILHYIRIWDRSAADRVDLFVANSRYIAERVRRCYRRKAKVIYPPVAVDEFPLQEQKEDFYLVASRMVPYKRIADVVAAFKHLPDRKLVVIGDGPEWERVQQRAGKNVELRGYRPFPELRKAMQQARAFLFAAEEDFGIMPVEAQACGTPVIAYGVGGACESVVNGRTGLFFEDRNPETIAAAIRRFEEQEASFQPAEIKQHAEKFSESRFRTEFSALVDRAMVVRKKRIERPKKG